MRRSVQRLHALHSTGQRDVGRETGELRPEPNLSFVWTSAQLDPTSPISAIIAGEHALQVAAALQQVAEPDRIVVEKRFVDGLRLCEIAEQEQTTIGTVAGRLRRGLQSLQQHLPLDVQ